jgi:hypothetical protein
MASSEVATRACRGALLVIALLCARTAAADANVSLVMGVRNETDSEEQPPMIGGAIDFGRDEWLFRPDLDASIGFDPLYGGEEYELGVGAIRYWDVRSARFHFGAGLSAFRADWGANVGSSTGVHVHAGASWRVKAHRWGLDLRYLSADDVSVQGGSFPVGYFQFSVLLAW